MSIWGRRDGEPVDEETHESQAEAPESQAEAPGSQAEAPGSQAEVHDAQEPAAEHRAGEPAPAFWRAQGETPAPVGRDPADAPPPDYEHVPDNPPAAGVQEPTAAVAREPVVNDAEEPAVAEPRGEVQEPAMTEAEQPGAASEPAAGTAGRPAGAVVTPQRWSEILVAFVDDPRASVKMAADAVDEAIDEFVNSVRARERGLAATWQSDGADTEQLRTALREYRKLGQRVQQLDLGEKTGG